jgi:hypothetical protein
MSVFFMFSRLRDSNLIIPTIFLLLIFGHPSDSPHNLHSQDRLRHNHRPRQTPGPSVIKLFCLQFVDFRTKLECLLDYNGKACQGQTL